MKLTPATLRASEGRGQMLSGAFTVNENITPQVLPQVPSQELKSKPKRKRRRKGDRPAKPYPDFPLFAHASGRWAKKIRGSLAYFGHWKGKSAVSWEQALQKYEAQREALYLGHRPVDPDGRFTVEKLVNKFLAYK